MGSQQAEKFKEYHLEVPEDENSGTRLDKYLAAAIDDTSRTKIQKAIEKELITVNGESRKSSYNIEVGDVIDVNLPIPKPPEAKAEDIPLDIVYEDEDLLVINKSVDMVVHPAPGNWSGTLVNALMWHTDKLSDPDSDMIRPGIVHRLDKDTSGLLVVAKNDATHRTLSSYFQTKDIERTYWAIVWGTPDEKEGTITGNIGRSPNNRKKMAVLPDGNGKSATTHYKVLEYFDHLTLLELTLETGRTHQIRVHLADNNLWVFGDPKYGGDSVRYGTNTGSRRQMFNNLFKLLQRQCLHAKTLGFEHPTTGKMMEFDSALPDDFKQVLQMLRQNCQPEHIY
ncbi:ribosomal large subunit pseudouridine synthase D [Fodinibius salinus]|uniref:Pseudouridine synthase n=1 Tax=Fodinibius salinus TaxID=860790 RepID=A0A5D3YM44_9BACT|nr:RluA family pseudouridine synthase [Fodinibius salinus]TYP94006.1 ribosomal large subunit pseudouridine synthase D [Fodinibius salinus]